MSSEGIEGWIKLKAIYYIDDELREIDFYPRSSHHYKKLKVFTITSNGGAGIWREKQIDDYFIKNLATDPLRKKGVEYAKEFISALAMGKVRVVGASKFPSDRRIDLIILNKNRKEMMLFAVGEYGWVKKSSYDWKHVVEEWYGNSVYISNGELIGAAIEVSKEYSTPIIFENLRHSKPIISIHSCKLAVAYELAHKLMPWGSHYTINFNALNDVLEMIVSDESKGDIVSMLERVKWGV